MNTEINSNYPAFYSGFKKTRKMGTMWLSASFFILKKYKNPVSFLKIVKRVNALKNRYTIKNTYHRMAREAL